MEDGIDVKQIEEVKEKPERRLLPPDMEQLRFSVRLYYQVQKLRVSTGNRVGQLERDGIDVSRYLNANYSMLEHSEKDISGQIKKLLVEQEIWNEWLKEIKGIGHILAGGIVSGIGDISKFDTVGNLWSYCGLAVELVEDEEGNIVGKAIRPKRGVKLNHNTKMKKLCWLIGESFVKTGGFYKERYKTDRFFYDNRADLKEESDMHKYLMAKRKTVKLFLSHLWEAWREIEGLPTRTPYAIEILKHDTKHYIRPSDAIAYDRKLKEEKRREKRIYKPMG